jgi:hypothetical protein
LAVTNFRKPSFATGGTSCAKLFTGLTYRAATALVRRKKKQADR